MAGAWTRVHRPGDSRRCPQKGLWGAGGKLRPEEEPKQGHHSRDPQGWRRRPRLRVTSPVLGMVSGLCSPAASSVQDPVQGCCAGCHSRSLTLMAARVPGAQMRKLVPALGCRKRKEGSGLCLRPRGSPLLLAPPHPHASPGVGGARSTAFSEKARGQDRVAEAV